MVEQLIRNQQVRSSILRVGSIEYSGISDGYVRNPIIVLNLKIPSKGLNLNISAEKLRKNTFPGIDYQSRPPDGIFQGILYS